VTVPLYDTSSTEQCRSILADAEPQMAIVADAELADRIRAAGNVDVIVIDDDGLEQLGRRGESTERAEVDRRVEALTTDDIATIVYTSGTTGDPKGCVLTHGNLAWTTVQTGRALHDVLREGGSLLQLLPLAHIFARLIQFVCLDYNLTVGFSKSPQDPREDVRSFRPTLFVGVPRAFEKVYESARRQARGGVKQAIFNFGASAGQAWSKSAQPGPALRARRAGAGAPPARRRPPARGGRVQSGVYGAAPHSAHLVH
jgi:long-chain acyl-CoA synthetase